MLDKRLFYINGSWVEPELSNDFDVIDPSTEETCAVISLGFMVPIKLLLQLELHLKAGCLC